MMTDNYEIVKALHEGILNVKFTKVNGDARVMKCTLKEDLLPEAAKTKDETSETKRRHNPDVQAVWDLEKEAWRSFRFDSIVEAECL